MMWAVQELPGKVIPTAIVISPATDLYKSENNKKGFRLCQLVKRFGEQAVLSGGSNG
jgi:hypothetical protein